MKKQVAPYGLQIFQSCLSCPVRENALFCDLSLEVLARLNAIRQTSLYPAGALLFVEGEPCRGIFVLCTGRAKLTASSPLGRSVIMRIAVTGEVLGLSDTLCGTHYIATAETLEPSQLNFLPQTEFLSFLESHGEVAVRVARHLSTELRLAYHQLARVVLAPTARAKLAGLLLDDMNRGGQATSQGTRCQLRLTHEEIGELIGTTRETVSRILGEFRRRGLIQIRGTTITVLSPDSLQALLGG